MKTHLIKFFKPICIVILLALMVACEKNGEANNIDVSGTYIGTLTGDFRSIQPATTVVSNIGDHIEVHCFADNFDVTITLDIYDNENRMMVCFTGDDFEEMYGHMLDEDHMNHNGSNWMQHLNNEHQEGDEHFGYFDIEQHMFDFIFRMSEGDYHFQGIKN